MAVKKKARKKSAKKMFSTQSSSRRLDQIAKEKMPKWRIVETAGQDSQANSEPDAVSPRLSKLQGRNSALSEVADADALGGRRKSSKRGLTGLVNMEPEDGSAGAGSKTQVFENDEHTGSQG